MMQHFRNQMLWANRGADNLKATTRIGIVSSFDPNRYAAVVQLQPDDTKTGWLPVVSPWAGNGWGLFAPPSIGSLVEVHFEGADMQAGFVCHRFFNDVDLPLNCPSGEFWVVHQSGSCIKFHNDGSVEISAKTNMIYSAKQHHFVGAVQMDNTLNVSDNIIGAKNITAGNDIADQGGGKTMSAMRLVYNSHAHGSSSTPNTSM